VLRVYRIPFSTNVERVALALAHKGIEVEWVDVDPADRTPVREASGQDLVPVLVEEDGTVVADSMRILARLEERFPEPPLYPHDPARRAEVGVFLDWFNRVWKRPPNELDAELSKPEPDPARVGALGAELAETRDVFESLLHGRDHLFGEFSVADCAAFPFLRYARYSEPDDEEQFHRILVDRLRPLDAHPRLNAWLERMEARPRG
jgi:RNA polymerase-associated protein